MIRSDLCRLIAGLLLLSACSGSPGLPAATRAASPRIPPSPSPAFTFTPRPQPTVTPKSPMSTVTPLFQACSPLQDVPLTDLPGMVVNPFNPPPPGSDNPHQGADFADLRAGDGIALAGRRVMAALPARVAAVMADRFPYGNALLLETPLDEIPVGWLDGLGLPTPGPAVTPVPALTCPDSVLSVNRSSRRSLYLLYAHMLESPRFELGEAVGCGQEIGAIGSSGNALNPHLHLEARLGPAAVQFGSLAHYDPSATQEEMANYCAWRVSGSFQAFDPLRLLRTAP